MIFGFVLPRIIDNAINQNYKILQELITIRKEIDSTNPDARKIDEIITYRRKRYLSRQIVSYEKMKNEDKYDEAKIALGGNIFQRIWWKVTSHQPTTGVWSLIFAFLFCLGFSIMAANYVTDYIVYHH